MRILGLDVGDKRMGLALSDELAITAQGLRTLTRDGIEKDLEALKEIISSNKVEEVVVGLPLNMNGSMGPRAKETLEFVEVLKGRIGLPVKLWDERLTSLEATQRLISFGMSRKKRKGLVDRMAAQLILQGYLDSKKAEKDTK